MKEVRVKIEGMKDMHCVIKLKRVLSAIPGALDVLVEVGDASITYDEQKFKMEHIEKAVTFAGYKLVK